MAQNLKIPPFLPLKFRIFQIRSIPVSEGTKMQINQIALTNRRNIGVVHKWSFHGENSHNYRFLFPEAPLREQFPEAQQIGEHKNLTCRTSSLFGIFFKSALFKCALSFRFSN